MELKELRGKERTAESGRRREKMVCAAYECFCRRGIAGTSIADIAREAEFGEATLYRYFANKETLVLECGMLFWSKVRDFMEEERLGPNFAAKSGMEQVEALIWRAYAFYRQNTAAFRLIHDLDGMLLSGKVGKGQVSGYEQAVDQMRPVLCDAIEKGKRDGSIADHGDTTVLYYALTNGIFSMMQKQAAAGRLLESDATVGEEQKLTQLLELLAAGLRAMYGKDEKG